MAGGEMTAPAPRRLTQRGLASGNAEGTPSMSAGIAAPNALLSNAVAVLACRGSRSPRPASGWSPRRNRAWLDRVPNVIVRVSSFNA